MFFCLSSQTLKGAAELGKTSVPPTEAQGDGRVTSDLMGSVHPLVQGLWPGRRAREVPLQALPSVLDDAGDTRQFTNQVPALEKLPFLWGRWRTSSHGNTSTLLRGGQSSDKRKRPNWWGRSVG